MSNEKYDWRYENSINNKKEYIDLTAAGEVKYNAFRTNRSLSNFPDTVMQANDVNCAYWLDAKLQYDYLFNSIRKKNRKFTQRAKLQKDDNFDLVQQYYKYSRKKTYDALAVLTPEQLEAIRRKMDKGGIK